MPLHTQQLLGRGDLDKWKGQPKRLISLRTALTLNVIIYFQNILWMASSWELICFLFCLFFSYLSWTIQNVLLNSYVLHCCLLSCNVCPPDPSWSEVNISGFTPLGALWVKLPPVCWRTPGVSRNRLFEWCGAFGDLCECHRNAWRDKYDLYKRN